MRTIKLDGPAHAAMPTRQAIKVLRPQRCGTCRFRFDDPTGGMPECRRNPPFPTVIPYQGGTDQQVAAAVSQGKPPPMKFITHTGFPRVNPDETSCGEWRVRIQGVAEPGIGFAVNAPAASEAPEPDAA